MRYHNNKRGQAILEMAIFGAIILFLFGVLLSYMQRQNDQQYVQMETFRRALLKGCTNNSSAQITNLENRRYADLSGSFRKGNPNTLSSSSSVFWAVPEVGGQPENNVVLRVNAEEKKLENPETSIENINFSTGTIFNEMQVKQETPSAITTTRHSSLEDTITTTFVDKDGNTVWEVTQGAYRDADGQYKYNSSHVGTEINRERTWETRF
jgi:uncharacterized protein (UPF0333 family)